MSTIIFFTVWIAFLSFIIYGFLQTCLRRNDTQQTPSSRPPRPPYRPRPGGSGGWFPGGMDNEGEPPPPYSKQTPGGNQGWRPGFWTGAAVGGLGNHLFNRQRAEPRPAPAPVAYDWEDRIPGASFLRGRRAPPATDYGDRGEGSSNLGAMRRSTGLGGSNVR